MPAFKRIGIYSIKEVLDRTILTPDGDKLKPSHNPECMWLFGDYPVNMTSQRYQLFLLRGTNCVHCGMQGRFFSLDQSVNSRIITQHFNLIAINSNCDEILMTKDHIIPRSKGGKDILENYQPMCSICNNKKGNKN